MQLTLTFEQMMKANFLLWFPCWTPYDGIFKLFLYSLHQWLVTDPYWHRMGQNGMKVERNKRIKKLLFVLQTICHDLGWPKVRLQARWERWWGWAPPSTTPRRRSSSPNRPRWSRQWLNQTCSLTELQQRFSRDFVKHLL